MQGTLLDRKENVMNNVKITVRVNTSFPAPVFVSQGDKNVSPSNVCPSVTLALVITLAWFSMFPYHNRLDLLDSFAPFLFRKKYTCITLLLL